MGKTTSLLCFLSLFLIFQYSDGQSFIPPKIFSVKIDSGIEVLCDNPNPVEMSVLLEYTSKNLSPIKSEKIFIVPPKSKSVQLNIFTKIRNNEGYSFTIKSKSVFGNVTAIHDKNFMYQLPYSSRIPIKVSQGYNGRFSHQGVKALDFNLPKGASILAAREGLIVFVQDKFDIACPEPRCAKFNNFVIVQHSDGSFAEYGHIRKGSASVKVDSTILAKQKIAEVGNTGYSSGPHLHFEVYTQDFSGKIYQETYFSTSENQKTLIKEGYSYLPSL